jgi:hypothetical protein
VTFTNPVRVFYVTNIIIPPSGVTEEDHEEPESGQRIPGRVTRTGHLPNKNQKCYQLLISRSSQRIADSNLHYLLRKWVNATVRTASLNYQGSKHATPLYQLLIRARLSYFRHGGQIVALVTQRKGAGGVGRADGYLFVQSMTFTPRAMLPTGSLFA